MQQFQSYFCFISRVQSASFLCNWMARRQPVARALKQCFLTALCWALSHTGVALTYPHAVRVYWTTLFHCSLSTNCFSCSRMALCSNRINNCDDWLILVEVNKKKVQRMLPWKQKGGPKLCWRPQSQFWKINDCWGVTWRCFSSDTSVHPSEVVNQVQAEMIPSPKKGYWNVSLLVVYSADDSIESMVYDAVPFLLQDGL